MIRTTIAIMVSLALSTAASAQSRFNVSVHNQTGTNINEIHLSYTGLNNTWGSNILANIVIPPDAESPIYIDLNNGVCIVHMWVRYSNGIDHTLRFNACSAQHIDAQQYALRVAF